MSHYPIDGSESVSGEFVRGHLIDQFCGSRLNRLRKKCLFVIPSEARDLLFFAKSKKKQIPRANPALRNDSMRVFPQPLKPRHQCTEKYWALAPDGLTSLDNFHL
jgi:hypothetical protein